MKLGYGVRAVIEIAHVLVEAEATMSRFRLNWGLQAKLILGLKKKKNPQTCFFRSQSLTMCST